MVNPFLERYKNDSINNMTRRITIDSSQLNNSLMDQLKIILKMIKNLGI